MFTSIRTNHFLWRELRRSLLPSPINWSFVLMRVIPLTFLTLVALLPTQYYINESRVDWLPLMAIVLFLPRPILAIRIIFMGIQSVRQDMIQGRWALLILTGISTRKIVWRKWIQVVWQTFPDQILFALPSIGLALGISQFFLKTDFTCGQQPFLPDSYKTISILFHPYCYINSSSFFVGQLSPFTIVFSIGILFIITMAIFEIGLNASIGVLAGLSSFAPKGLGMIYGITTRVCLLVVICLAIPLMQDFINKSFDCYHVMFIKTFTCQQDSHHILRNIYRVADTIEVAVMPLLDQGTLLAANVMRPNDSRLLRIYLSMDYQNYKLPQIFFWYSSYDNRPFVLRNIIAFAMSGFFYYLLIRYFLRRATRFAIVNHGASGYLEL